MNLESTEQLKVRFDRACVSRSRGEIASILRDRLIGRFSRPALSGSVRHGFLFVSVASQLIESYMSFRKGLKSTEGKSGECFRLFFSKFSDSMLSNLSEKQKKRVIDEFYKNVRCGLLHETETRGRWRIQRRGKHPINIDSNGDMVINGVKFLKSVENSIENLADELRANDWDSALTVNVRRKIEFIINA